MYRETVERLLLEDCSEGEYLFPTSEYCISNVPETALSVLDESFDSPLPEDVFDGVSTDVENVLVVVLDGYGLERWKRDYRDDPFLGRLTDGGTVTPLTSVYPSETAAALTTLYTGLEPAEHGLLGWYQHLEPVGEDVVTLPFTTPEGEPLSEVAPAAEARDLFEGDPLSARAVEAGIDVHAVLPDAYVDSGYSRAVTAGAERTGYDTAADFAYTVRRVLETAGPTFVHAYQPTLDVIAHEEGTGTDRYRVTLAAITDRLRRELLEKCASGTAKRTLLVLTADHGIVDTVPTENVDLVSREWWPTLEGAFRRDADGSPRPPTGGPRNTHFHVRPGRLEDAREILEAGIDGRVFTRAEALERGLFGPVEPSTLFERRCGDLMAVHRNRGLCWHDSDRRLVGMHGGLTGEEMLVPLAVARLDNL